MNNKFSDLQKNDLFKYNNDDDEYIPQEFQEEIKKHPLNYSPNYESSRKKMHFSLEELLSSSNNLLKAKLFKSLLVAAISIGLTYGFAYSAPYIGIPKETAKQLIVPIAGAASIFGSQFLNDIFAFVVSKVKGKDYEEDTELVNDSDDYAKEIQKAFDNKEQDFSPYFDDNIRRL